MRKVVEDEILARRLGVSSVPAMLVGRTGELLEEAGVIAGARPSSDRVEAAVERARKNGTRSKF